MWRRDGTFTMTTAYGLRYYVHREVDAGPETRGEARLVLSSGDPVDRLRAGEYVVRSTGLRLWCIDPKAP